MATDQRKPVSRVEKRRQTGAAIFDAARVQFAEVGFERPTIRSVTAAAGVDPALVRQYFGSKAGLFAVGTEQKQHRRLLEATVATRLVIARKATSQALLQVAVARLVGSAPAGKKPCMADDRSRSAARALADREAEVMAQLARIETASARTTAGGIGFGKRVGDGTPIAVERMTDVAAHTGLLRELAQIGRARAAVEAGTYGTCEVCGRPIGADRLEARPASTRCVRCA